ncbi:phytoene synthase [Catellatospora sp. TT07R-123]|uniref:phytoene/squalene synthase family protein n=1 Tax=Catellatospora sp. TT07R-123 TaxID=2733863 RepID=UPI001B26C375|nr:phytoene/squalene synthase family protein [Catellatospora sp. TT07R-123]GHJ45548.1 phytoene synthase [Catellatospora sp. TT07R-123]
MTATAVTAAAVPGALAGAYARCRDLHRRHGRSYYLATRLLPAWKRPHVHALYGFARHADDIVDDLGDGTGDGTGGDLAEGTGPMSTAERARRLRDFADRFDAGLRGEPVDDPILPAVLHTAAVFELDPADFAAFFDSMAMDLTIGRYADYAALLSYMEGSAAVIGTLMLPVLGPADPGAAREPARQLGLAFQLTNFLRDVAEDLARGRIYLPQEDLARFGVGEADLCEAAARRRAGAPVRALIGYGVERARAHYAAAAPGLDLLPGASRTCVRAAYAVYGAILDEIERADHDVFVRRAVVPAHRRATLLARTLLARTLLP